MIIKFNDGAYDVINMGKNIVRLNDKFKALSNWENTTKLYTDDYEDELNPATQIIFINDFVTDDWLSKCNLQLEKEIFKELRTSDNFNQAQQKLDLMMNDINNRLLMLDLPVNYQRNLELNMGLIKYFRIQLQQANSVQDKLEQLLKVHSRIENSKALMLNHVNDYNVDINNEDVKSLGIKLLLLE